MKTFEENFKTEDVHISTIRPGDTVFHNGKAMTVCKRDIIKGGFCGTALFGYSYRSGYEPVKKYVGIK